MSDGPDSSTAGSYLDVAAISAGLTEQYPGFWSTDMVEEVSYPELGHRWCRAVEDTSFWFEHRLACIRTVVARYPPSGVILDVGAGNGAMAVGMTAAGFPSAALEPGAEGSRNAYERGVRPVIRGTLEASRLTDGALAAASMFDVLEHIADDVGYVRSVRRILSDGGRLYVTVPAYPVLWSADDERAGHHRRYTMRTLGSALSRGDLEVEFMSAFFRPLPPGILVKRTIPTRLGLRHTDTSPESDHTLPTGVVGAAVESALRRELLTLQRGRLRFGSSLIAVAVRRG